MAIAFYIPDQAVLLRKAREQEQKILRMREIHWKFIASIVVDAMQQYLRQATAPVLRRSCGSSCKLKKSNPY